LEGSEKYIDDLKDEKEVETKTSLFMVEHSKTYLNINEPISMPSKVNSQTFNSFFKLNPPFLVLLGHIKRGSKRKRFWRCLRRFKSIFHSWIQLNMSLIM
jgi:hypothetical protein